MIRSLIVLMLICINGFCQETKFDGLKYATSQDIASFDYDKELKQIAGSSQVIGLGEATHGTAEFEELRVEIIKLLVTKYGYRHVVLEASHTQCMALNKYINTGEGNPAKILVAFVSWPFATKGMYDLMHWLREYNEHLPEQQKVQFYGIDMYTAYVYKYVKMEEEKYGVAKDCGWIDTVLFSRLEKVDGNEKEKHQQYNAILKEQMNSPEKLMDSIAKTNVIRSYILQNISHGGKRYAYRESLLYDMASVLIDSVFKGEKAIIYGHNNHVSKQSSDRKTLGNMLYDRYGDKYQVVGTELRAGVARAKVLTNGKYKLELVDIVEQPKTLGYQLRSINKGLLGISADNNRGNPLIDKKQEINDFGAVYYKEKADKLATESLKVSSSFNYLFIIDDTHATENIILNKL